MGVYIKGMEMPENCAMCPLCHRNFDGNETRLACYALKKWCDENIDRLSDCPLVEVPEPHGDLIDREILEQGLRNGIKAGNLEEGYEHYANINNMDDCVECVKYADTVIEAEGE